MKQTLTIIRGLPGSGKSTMALKLLGVLPESTVWAEADHYFTDAAGGYAFDTNYLRDAHATCFGRIADALDTGRSAIVSNTFSTIRELRPYFDIAFNRGIVPDVVSCFDNFGSIHDVPKEVIERMRSRFCHDISELYARETTQETL